MITIIQNGKFTGTQYTKEQFTKEVQEFHKSDSWIDKEPFNISPNENGEIDFGSPTQEELNQSHNNTILSQISAKENELVRPMRELLSTATSEEDKAFAQSRIDNIEREIQSLRSQLL